MEKFGILKTVNRFIKLKKRGVNYIGLCPFHNEKTPSFYVHPVKNIFKCFGCGKGGDSIDFLMAHQSLSFSGSVQWLNDLNGTNYTPTEANEIRKYVADPDYLSVNIDTSGTGILKDFIISHGFGVEEIFDRYKVSSLDNGWCVFWYVDIKGKIRSGKYMKYLKDGHRDKSQQPSWEHKRRDYKGELYPNFNFVQCFFGEYLLSEDLRKPIAIVESEKTAIIASIFIDRYIWIACGSKNGLTQSKCEVLANRSVTLFPDLGAYDLWALKAKEFNFNISDHLEKIATDEQRESGYDLADFLIY